MTEQNTALATREQHPLAEQLDKRQAALAEMLPGGERAAQRFKRVVTQAVIRTPSLMECTQTNAGLASLMAAVMEAATLGIEPTGVLGGAHLVPFKGKAQLIIGYRGLIELARRSGEIESIEARVVREGDDFAYQYGTEAAVRHVPLLDAETRPLTHVYAVAKLRGGAVQFEVMTREQVESIRNQSSGYKYAESSKRRDSPWHLHDAEMWRKTAVRRLVKYLPIAVEARDLIERDDSREFEPGAVVARVSGDERASTARARIAERTAAMRGERIEQGESEAVSDDGAVPGRQPSHEGGSPVEAREEPIYEGTVMDIDDVPFSEPAGGKGDPWMRRIHAVGAERGLDHDALHAMAEEHFGIDSMAVLDDSERAELLSRVESIDPPQPGAQPASGNEAQVDARPPAPTTPDADGQGTAVDPATAAPAEAEGSPPATDSAAPPASIEDPDTLRTFAATVLGLDLSEVWGLGDLSPADFDQVWDALKLPAGDEYTAWYNAQKRPLRQALMAAGQSPRKRKDWAAAAEPVGAK